MERSLFSPKSTSPEGWGTALGGWLAQTREILGRVEGMVGADPRDIGPR